MGEGRKLTPEEFKSFAMGYYQCVNAVSMLQIELRRKSVRLGGSVEEIFQICGMSRVISVTS